MANSLPMGWRLEPARCAESEPPTDQFRRPVVKVGAAHLPRGRPAILKPGSKGVLSHYVYVDNFGTQSLEEQAAKEGLDAATAAFQEKHQTVHETEVQCEKKNSALGTVLDGRMRETRAREVRLRRVRSAIGTALRRGRMSGRELENFLGYCTYLALVKRPLLSCSHASYRYVQSTYWTKTVLWNSVVQALTNFLLLTVVGAVVNRGVLDRWSCEEVAEAGRRNERSRYRLGAESAREHALAQIGFVVDHDIGKVREAGSEDKASIPLMGAERWEEDPGFEEIPPSLLVGSRWRTLSCG